MRLSITAVLLLFLVQTGMRTLQVVNFYVQQDRIEDLFCVNKDKPKLQCHGKCHLAKQVEQQEKKSLPVKLILSSEVNLVVEPWDQSFLSLCEPVGGKDMNTPYFGSHSCYVMLEILRPPDSMAA